MNDLDKLHEYCRIEKNNYEREAKYIRAHSEAMDMNASHKRAAAEAVVYAMARVIRKIEKIKKCS